jgi:hypothetical protein
MASGQRTRRTHQASFGEDEQIASCGNRRLRKRLQWPTPGQPFEFEMIGGRAAFRTHWRIPQKLGGLARWEAIDIRAQREYRPNGVANSLPRKSRCCCGKINTDSQATVHRDRGCQNHSF